MPRILRPYRVTAIHLPETGSRKVGQHIHLMPSEAKAMDPAGKFLSLEPEGAREAEVKAKADAEAKVKAKVQADLDAAAKEKEKADAEAKVKAKVQADLEVEKAKHGKGGGR